MSKSARQRAADRRLRAYKKQIKKIEKGPAGNSTGCSVVAAPAAVGIALFVLALRRKR